MSPHNSFFPETEIFCKVQSTDIFSNDPLIKENICPPSYRSKPNQQIILNDQRQKFAEGFKNCGYHAMSKVQIAPRLQLLWETKPLPEILLHERQPLAQGNLRFPPQQFLGLRNVWLPLARIIRGVLHYFHRNVGVDQLKF